MKLAKRLEKLGTETAFEVSACAANWAAKGNKVYPFHLGDLNIATPQSIIDNTIQAIRDGQLGGNIQGEEIHEIPPMENVVGFSIR